MKLAESFACPCSLAFLHWWHQMANDYIHVTVHIIKKWQAATWSLQKICSKSKDILGSALEYRGLGREPTNLQCVSSSEPGETNGSFVMMMIRKMRTFKLSHTSMFVASTDLMCYRVPAAHYFGFNQRNMSILKRGYLRDTVRYEQEGLPLQNQRDL